LTKSLDFTDTLCRRESDKMLLNYLLATCDSMKRRYKHSCRNFRWRSRYRFRAC